MGFRQAIPGLDQARDGNGIGAGRGQAGPSTGAGGVGSGWCPARTVIGQNRRAAAGRDQCEAIAADRDVQRFHHAEHRHRRDGGIHGIAAVMQHR
jgi:hypothetical protein